MLRPTRVLALLSVFVLLAASSAIAGRLADLPWDDKIPQEVRSGVRQALQKESTELTKETNAAGKKFVRVYTNAGVELAGDKASTTLTIQRCLDDKMVTELWKYTLEKKGKDYEITGRDKLHEVADAYHIDVQKVDQARPVKPFTFEHDLLKLSIESGWAGATTWNGKPSAFAIAGKGHLTIRPLNEQEALYFERRLKTKLVDTDIERIEVSFHPDNRTFTDLLGWDEAPASRPTDAKAADALRDMYDEVMKDRADKEYTPYVYGFPSAPEYIENFGLRIKTAKHGWLSYAFSPTSPLQVAISVEKGTLSFRASDTNERLVSVYPAPALRAASPLERGRFRGYRDITPLKFEGQFDIDTDKFTALVDTELVLLRESTDLYFFLTGNPTVRYVRIAGKDVPFVPVPNFGSLLFGFEETNNVFRVMLPEKKPAGTILRAQVSFESPKVVRMISDGFWYIDRQGFLPFMGGLDEPSAIRFVMRTRAPYTHIAIGSKLGEEVTDGYRYTEWGSDRMINFPTMIIGKYFEPVVQESEGLTVTGYMTQNMMGPRRMDAQRESLEIPNPGPKAMKPQVDQALQSTKLFTALYQLPYPFKDLKLVGTPAQGLSAQSPTSIIYVGEMIFWPETFMMSYGTEIFGPTFDPMWTRAVTAHENAHQWWGGRVSSINFQSYWLVESLAEVSSFLYVEAIKDKVGAEHTLNYWRTAGMGGDHECPVDQPWMALTGRGGLLRYTKGPFVVNMLRHYYGIEKLYTFLRTAMQTYDGDLICTEDLKRIADRVFGEDMGWFFDQYVSGMGIPEIAYKFDSPAPAEDGKGWIITGKLQQTVLHNDKPLAGKVFKRVLVPIVVETESGPVVLKEFLEDSSKDLRLRVEAKPKQAPKVDPDHTVWITTRAL